VKLHPVDVWTISLEIRRASLLSEDEEARAARFRFDADRLRWTQARSALRRILASFSGSDPTEIAFTYGENGKPAAGGIEFSLSHTGPWAMIAVSGDVPVGIDIEQIRENVEIRKLLERIARQPEKS